MHCVHKQVAGTRAGARALGCRSPFNKGPIERLREARLVGVDTASILMLIKESNAKYAS